MKQNILVLMSDEHSPKFMGCSGHPFIRTPNLDALAARGIRFPHAYTPSPICVPARAAFATGRRVHQIRNWDNASPYRGTPPSWGHALQSQGIRVESIGKLHYRNTEDDVGFDREHLPMHVVGGHGMVWGSIRDPLPTTRLVRRMLGNNIGPGDSPYIQYDRGVTAEAVRWLENAASDGRPFALYVGLVAPHFPLTAPPEFFEIYKDIDVPESKLHPSKGYIRHPWVQAYADFIPTEDGFVDAQERRNAFLAYYALCSFLDHNVGAILKALADSGLADNTTVIYTSDHGDNVGARGLWGKSTLYQESVQVPMLMAGPGISSGVCATPVDLLDLYPTILDATGVLHSSGQGERPGRSLLDIANAPDEPARVIFSEYHATGTNSAGFMVRAWPWKLHYYVGHSPELFNLESDPEEMFDLAGNSAYVSTLQEMESLLRSICDPEAVDRQAKEDQAALIEAVGGREVAQTMGSKGATPAPAVPTSA